MAKKFYYYNRNKQSAKQSAKQTAKPATQIESNLYPVEKMSITLENMGVSVKTAELLAKNKINTAGDIVIRTERDMFKVQGFNKKMLFELKDALKAMGMEFRPPVPKAPKQVQEQKSEKVDKVDAKPQKGKQDKNGTSQEKQAKLTEPLPVEEWRKVQKGGKWGFHDGMKTVIEPSYDEVFCFRDGLASVELDEKCGYINPQGEVVITFEYETAMSFSEGLAAVAKRDKFGYIDKEDTLVIPFEYDAATAFENGEAKVKKDGKWGTISTDGTVKWI